MTADPIALAIRREHRRIAAGTYDLKVQRRALIAAYLEADRLWQARLAALDRLIADEANAACDAVEAERTWVANQRMGRAA